MLVPKLLRSDAVRTSETRVRIPPGPLAILAVYTLYRKERHMALGVQSPEERAQLDALKAHQKTVRTHVKAQATKDALAEALAEAQIAHSQAGVERSAAKTSLLDTLKDA